MITINEKPSELIGYIENDIIISGITDVSNADTKSYVFRIVVSDNTGVILDLHEKSLHNSFSINLKDLLKKKITKFESSQDFIKAIDGPEYINNVGNELLYAFELSVTGSYKVGAIVTNDIVSVSTPLSSIYYLIGGTNPLLKSPPSGYLNNITDLAHNVSMVNAMPLFFISGFIKGQDDYTNASYDELLFIAK